jgi:hypothetical protein
VARDALTVRLRRQTRLFRRWFPAGDPPALVWLTCYEVVVRGGLDLVAGLLLWVPILSHFLRPWLRARLVCAFLGFEDAGETRVGCVLHPTRWEGNEQRPRAAFRLLRGLGCGAPDYLCLAALWFARAGWQDRARFHRESAGRDWYDFSKAAATFRPSS